MLFNKLLIVDDDENFINIYKKIFTRKKYLVEITDSAKHAVDMIMQGEYDILITDM